MPSEPLPQAADAGHLTDVLRRSGVLGDGRVCDVQVESLAPRLISRVMRLRLAYEGASGAPATLILKIGLPKRRADGRETGRREVEFYTRLAALTPARLFPLCFDAVFEPGTKAWHLLLEDLADTHTIATQWPLPPTMEDCKRMLDVLARFHAGWWDDRRLGVSVGVSPDKALNEVIEKSARFYRNFADRLGDRLSPERRDIYERARNLSIIHGDAHTWNYFVPREGGDGVRLFDWDSWRIGLASTDLAYMMAVHWYPERRRMMERPLLDHYHETLMFRGVQGYRREELDEDYRLSVLRHLMTPVLLAAIDFPPVIWWGYLERIMLAIDDLGCRSFLV